MGLRKAKAKANLVDYSGLAAAAPTATTATSAAAAVRLSNGELGE